jgi:hypothetical protein
VPNNFYGYGVISGGQNPPKEQRYGVFFSDQNQPIQQINTGQIISLNNTQLSNKISINSNRIIIQNPDIYSMNVTLLIQNFSNNLQDVTFWLKFMGIDYPNSGHFESIKARKNDTTPSQTILTYNFIGQSTQANQYVELYWKSTSLSVSLSYTVGVGVPNSPSAIVNIQNI